MKKTRITAILTPPNRRNQAFLELSKCVQNGSLTRALDLLEKRGITGDTAILFITNLQELTRGEAIA